MAKKVKIKMKANELHDADVSYISLVDRPANRIPFRITKAEESTSKEESLMFNLNTLMRKSDPEPQTPAIAAIVIRKEDEAGLKDQLVEAGFSVDSPVEEEEIVIYKQMDFDEDKVVAVKFNDDVMALVTDVKKEFTPFPDSMSFSDNIQAGAFLPGVAMATDVMMDTVRQCLRKSSNPDEAKQKLKAVLDDYKKYVLKLADNLPEMAFKLENIMAIKDENEEAVSKAENELENEGKEDVSKAMNEDKKGKGKCPEGMMWDEGMGKCVAKAKKEEGEENAASASEDKEDKVSKSEEPEGKKEAGNELGELLAAFKSEVLEGINSVKTELEEVKKGTAELKDRIDQVEEVAKSADEAVRGTVRSGSEDGDFVDMSLGNRSRRSSRKSDDGDIWAGVLDDIVPDIAGTGE